MARFSDLRPMTIGEVLDRSFQVLRRHVGPLFATAVLGILPMLGIYLSMTSYSAAPTPQGGAAAATLFGVFYLLMLLTTAVSWGALTRDVDRAIQRQAVSFTDGLTHGLRAFFRIIGFWIMAYLAGLVILVPAVLAAGVVVAVVVAVLGQSVLAGVIGFTVGAAVFVGAGLVWAPIGFMGLPAMIVEGLGPIKAVRRAHDLGKGGRLRVAATAFVAWIIMMLPTLGLSFVLGLGLAVWDPTASGTSSSVQLYVYQAVSFLVTGLTTPFMVAAMVFTYYDRRVRREGYDVELAAEPPLQAV